MRFVAAFGGIALLILGILMVLFGTYVYTVNIPKLESRLIFDNYSFVVGDQEVHEADFSGNVTVTCFASIRVPATGEEGDITFYVMSGEEFQRWKRGEDGVKFIIERPKTGSFNITFHVDVASTYYFIFDNTYSELYKKEVIFSVIEKYVTYIEETKESRNLVFIGYLAIAFGVVVTVYGLVRKPEVTWA